MLRGVGAVLVGEERGIGLPGVRVPGRRAGDPPLTRLNMERADREGNLALPCLRGAYQAALPARLGRGGLRAVRAEPEWISAQWEKARLHARAGSGPPAVLSLDEIQKIPNWSESVKRLWGEDTRSRLPLHVVLLGSAPLLNQRGLAESLAGRFEIIRVPHWSLAEMRTAFGFELDQYLYFGGYPGGGRAGPRVGAVGPLHQGVPDRNNHFTRRPAPHPGGQARSPAPALRAGLPILQSDRRLHQAGRGAPGRREYHDPRALCGAPERGGHGGRAANFREARCGNGHRAPNCRCSIPHC